MNDASDDLPPITRVDEIWYREIVESAPDATIMIDSEGRIVLVNRQTETLFGYERGDLLGQTIEKLVPENYRGRHHVHRDGYFTEPNVREMGAGLELSGVRADGTEFPVEISLSPLRTDRGVFATAAIRDATSRRAAEMQFKNLLETAPDAMIIIDDEGVINLVNQQAEHLFGYERDGLIGQPVEILVPDRLRDRHVGHRAGYFQDPKVRGMGAGLELWGRRKDGTEFPIEISLSPLEPEDGRLATAAVRDITERKAAQVKLTDYARHLEASNKELEEFAYVASHDMQAPLRNIISFTELLNDELEGKLTDEAAEFFGFIQEGALRMQALIKDLLEVSRVNRMERSFTVVDINKCLHDALDQLKTAVEESSATVEHSKLPHVRGDAGRITQLLQNLLSNAMKFQPDGRSPVVKITTKRKGDFWEFSIADNGIGLVSEEAVQIFEIFRRLHTADEYPGTGIGLSICKKIVEAHGGQIWVESQYGEGACFRFTLPTPDAIMAGDDRGR